MKVTTVGIDLAKNVFQLHGINEFGEPVIKKQIRRDQMAEFFVNMPACLIGMEACGSAHHWARKLVSFGHTVKLMAPQFVKPYVKTNKNDAADHSSIEGEGATTVARSQRQPCTTEMDDTLSGQTHRRDRQQVVRCQIAVIWPTTSRCDAWL